MLAITRVETAPGAFTCLAGLGATNPIDETRELIDTYATAFDRGLPTGTTPELYSAKAFLAHWDLAFGMYGKAMDALREARGWFIPTEVKAELVRAGDRLTSVLRRLFNACYDGAICTVTYYKAQQQARAGQLLVLYAPAFRGLILDLMRQTTYAMDTIAWIKHQNPPWGVPAMVNALLWDWRTPVSEWLQGYISSMAKRAAGEAMVEVIEPAIDKKIADAVAIAKAEADRYAREAREQAPRWITILGLTIAGAIVVGGGTYYLLTRRKRDKNRGQ